MSTEVDKELLVLLCLSDSLLEVGCGWHLTQRFEIDLQPSSIVCEVRGELKYILSLARVVLIVVPNELREA